MLNFEQIRYQQMQKILRYAYDIVLFIIGPKQVFKAVNLEQKLTVHQCTIKA